jgi:hypothetical protein
MNCGKGLLLSFVSCGLAGACMVGCATPPASDQAITWKSAPAAVAAICQNVMGLSPGERLRGGNWLGNDKLDYWTSYYRGCLTSLSESVQDVRDTQVVQQAEERCRTRGLLPGSPDLALCVLQTANERPQPTDSQTTEKGETSVIAKSAAAGSFYFASPSEAIRREQISCAALGLSPAQAEFKSCVQQLKATFYAIDHPIG